MLELGSVTYGYPDASDPAVRDVSLTIGPGERVCLLGANGSGKSTVARLACGDLEPLAGQVLLDGTDLSQLLGRAEVSLVAQDPRCQLVSPRVWDEVAFGPRCAGLLPDEVERSVREALAACDIAELGGRRCDELSGGQQQLLVIAAAIATRPRYLVLDEAGSHLDAWARATVREVVQRLCDEGLGVLQVTHDLEEVVGADRVLVMVEGALVWQGTPEAFGADSAVQELATGTLPEPHALDLTWLSPEMPADVRLDHATVRYDEVVALEDVSLAAQPGELLMLCGACGSGKSTAAHLMAGLLAPTKGRALLGESDVVAGSVGLAFQSPEDQLFMPTVLDDVAYGPRNLGMGPEEAHVTASRALEAMGVPQDRWGVHARTLSGGMRRRVAIASILALSPRAFVFDEPTAGLDGAGRALFHQVVSALANQGCTVVLVTHDPQEWQGEATGTLWLGHGHLLSDMPPQGLRASVAAGIASGEVPRSPLAHIDVRVRLASLVALTVGLLCVRTPIDLALACCLVGILCALGRVRWKRAARPLRATLPLLAFVLLAHGVRIDGTGDLTLVGTFGLSAIGLAQGGFAAARIVLLVVLAWAYAQDLSAPELADGLARMLSPFGCLGLPVADVSMVLSVALAFAVQVVPEFFRIERAQRARGAHFDDGPLLSRLREWLAVLSPLVVLLFDRAEALARSMRLRGYRGSLAIERRRLSLIDWLFLGATAAAVAAMAC